MDTQDLQDQLAREKIVTIADVPTLYRPLNTGLMVAPLPEISKIGSIIIPDRARLSMNEGIIVAKGDKVPDEFGIGDCITWDETQDNQMEIEGVKFILVGCNHVLMRIPKEALDKSRAARPKIEPSPTESNVVHIPRKGK